MVFIVFTRWFVRICGYIYKAPHPAASINWFSRFLVRRLSNRTAIVIFVYMVANYSHYLLCQPKISKIEPLWRTSIGSNAVREWPDSAVRQLLAATSAYFSRLTRASGTCSSHAFPCPAAERLWRIFCIQCPCSRRQSCATASSSNPRCWCARCKCNPTIAGKAASQSKEKIRRVACDGAADSPSTISIRVDIV